MDIGKNIIGFRNGFGMDRVRVWVFDNWINRISGRVESGIGFRKALLNRDGLAQESGGSGGFLSQLPGLVLLSNHCAMFLSYSVYQCKYI